MSNTRPALAGVKSMAATIRRAARSAPILLRSAVVAVVAAASLFAVSTPAHAAYDRNTCTIPAYTGIEQWCYSGFTPAHSTQHWVHIHTEQLARSLYWQVVDVGNGHIVDRGSGSADRTTYGLYGTYQLQMYGYGANGYITNYT